MALINHIATGQVLKKGGLLCLVDEQTWQIFRACGAEPRQSGGHRECASDGDSDSPARIWLYELAGGFISRPSRAHRQ